MARCPRARKASSIPDSLHRQLNMYALAAGAAGVCLLALPQASEAEIIYTKAHRLIGEGDIFPLDLNHDGVVDFTLAEHLDPFVNVAFGNGVEASFYASALTKGQQIGPQQRFTSSGSFYGKMMAFYHCTQSSRCSWRGPWVNVSNRYLGLKFQIDGKTHYGWARLSVQTGPLLVTGYAYETIPNRGILAGQVSGKEDSAPISNTNGAGVPLPASVDPVPAIGEEVSLGDLALGAQSPNLRTRK